MKKIKWGTFRVHLKWIFYLILFHLIYFILFFDLLIFHSHALFCSNQMSLIDHNSTFHNHLDVFSHAKINAVVDLDSSFVIMFRCKKKINTLTLIAILNFYLKSNLDLFNLFHSKGIKLHMNEWKSNETIKTKAKNDM